MAAGRKVLNRFTIVAAIAVLLSRGAAVSAQSLPAGPVRALDGRLVASGEITGTFGEADESAYFNYTDYEHNALRMLRAALTASWRPTERLALVGEVRSENMRDVRAYAAYVRIRPLRGRAFDVQAGLIPPTFGAFSRRAYASDNFMIGFPLAYQYLTSLRSDAVPATADDLLRMRGRGWRSSFPIGSYYEGPGLSLISAFRWDAGVQARWETGPLELSSSITTGSISNPRYDNDVGGSKLSGRVALRPITGLVLGASATRSNWLSREVTAVVPARDYSQRAFGADAEYSRDYWLVRGELVWAAWDLPYLGAAGQPGTVSAVGAWIEGRYRVTPRVFVALRGDRLGFSSIADSQRTEMPWDAPMQRGELVGGYYFQRNLVARLGVQRNVRLGAGRVRSRTYVTGQLTYWF